MAGTRISPDDCQALLAAAGALGESASWTAADRYDGLALAILDSVWSLGAHYDRHVGPVLDRYREVRQREGGVAGRDGSGDLVRAIGRAGGPVGFADLVGNHQRAWRRRTAPLKAESVLAGAGYLSGRGVETAEALRGIAEADPAAGDALRRGWQRAVPGQRTSSTGWRYLLLLTGVQEVKPDTMVIRWVGDVVGRPVSPDEARDAVLWLAANYPGTGGAGVPARALDHRVWRKQSGRAP